ncbi:MAG: protein phosphatase 2C domain-containing protein [Proteobacteria bacterium]|nr:protein phosphatase 2C domain-containing protein [Pseudomonadota bacterium]
MKIESFSESRDPDRPDANEDSLLVVPGRCLAVIDGVTDRTGARFDGVTSGRIASRAVAKSLAAFIADPAEADADPQRLVAALSAGLREEYGRLGILDAVRADKGRRFGATLAAAIECAGTFRFVRIGDSGVRIDARDILIDETRVDRVTSAIRRAVYAHLAGTDAAMRARVGRACVINGLGSVHPDMRPWLDAQACAAMRATVYDAAKEIFPQAAAHDLAALIDGGVSKGQAQFANVDSMPFGYGVLDGFDIPPVHVHCEDRPSAGVKSVELFTDGYFKIPAGASLAAWEEAFAEVEREDPEKLGRYAAPKGSLGSVHADDRTVVVATS